MANLTVAKTWRTRDQGLAGACNAYQATDAVQFYAGGLIGLNRTTGLAVKFSDTAVVDFLGMANRSVLGAAAGTPVPEVEVNEAGLVIEYVNVTGVTAITNVGDRVYLATDNAADFKVATNANNGPIGKITRWHSAAICDVQLLTPNQYLAQEDIA